MNSNSFLWIVNSIYSGKVIREAMCGAFSMPLELLKLVFYLLKMVKSCVFFYLLHSIEITSFDGVLFNVWQQTQIVLAKNWIS